MNDRQLKINYFVERRCHSIFKNDFFSIFAISIKEWMATRLKIVKNIFIIKNDCFRLAKKTFFIILTFTTPFQVKLFVLILNIIYFFVK